MKLWTRAYGLCSFPDCGRELIWGNEVPGLRGHMAHIIAASPTWTRGDPEADPGTLYKYENLILLCPNHHGEIDADQDRYTAEALTQMKSQHEERIRERLTRGEIWQRDLTSLEYLNVPRILLDPAAQEVLRGESAASVSLETTTLRDMGMNLVPVLVAFEEVFKAWQAQAVPLSVLDEFGEKAVGARISFEGDFRTKGMTGSDKMEPGFTLSGDIEKDPHIYVKTGGRKVILPLDPRWVTTSTAFVNFTGGRGEFAGLGLLKSVSDDRAVVSPLVVGSPPLSDEIRAFYDALTPG